MEIFCLLFRIQKLRIHAKEHMAQTQLLDPENPFFEVFVCPELGILQCGGIEIFGKTLSAFLCLIGWSVFFCYWINRNCINYSEAFLCYKSEYATSDLN